MLKLLICILCFTTIGVLLLELRQQKLELDHQANILHNKIESQQAKLWSEQLQIAVYTAPNAISKTVGDDALELVPQSPTHVGPASWLDVHGDTSQPVN